ncbi:XRE family transcriptional regulator [Roseibium sp.]|uniref:XRE family transcriptional regulator n=1 Tax=Roseibium sp. TaxID=1936156 RepID=UPI003B51846D
MYNEVSSHKPENLLPAWGIIDEKDVARSTASQELDLRNKDDSLKSITSVFNANLNRSALAKALKQVRDLNGLSQRAAADLAEVSHTDIKRIENGTSSLDKSTEVLNALGFDVQIQVVPKNSYD